MGKEIIQKLIIGFIALFLMFSYAIFPIICLIKNWFIPAMIWLGITILILAYKLGDKILKEEKSQ